MERARLTVAVAATAALAACSSAGAAPQVHQGGVAEVRTGALTARDVAAAQTAFGVDLLHEVCAGQSGQDVLLSPTSAAEALGLLYPATAGETADAFGSVLHLPSWSTDLVAATRAHTAALDGLRHDGDLDDEDAPDALQLSNHLWTALGVQPEQAYLDDLATAFAADVRALDFAGDRDGATDRINSTVAEDTRGVIEELFDEPLPSATRAVLTNAVHLKARWAVPFTSTRPAPFATPDGERQVDMMGGATGRARTAEGWEAVELPYRDGTLAAVAVLPPEGIDPCAVDAATLAALDAAEASDVDVQLPRLHVEQTHQLLEPLSELGLPVAGAFPGLGAGDVEIAQVVQKTYLDVDEQGTEAAAATGVAMAASARLPQRLVSFDRPFPFVLTDTATRSPLFVTAVYSPSA
ncbi:serpin family protein [Modestobacter italicus]|uniref:serpin family protein n=1 Tax=Modestobacter italicus (strain DSM 44449 / CECT 9708 / BC 501) TaxID=2732864 RepID=UPI001C97E5B7|nr:serpin family protein [Modestobacter italicus]